MHSPTDASPPSLRTASHGSGPTWIATPSSYRTCTDFSLPVSRRTAKDSGHYPNKTALAMIFKLAEAAEKSWRRLNGHNQLPKIILGIKFTVLGIKFTDGIEVVRSQAQIAAA
jgi:hypothetical protein